jgi:hypothetical protein
MALTREEIEHIARCKANCVLAGITFGHSPVAYLRSAPTIIPENVAGLVKEDELMVPHSELAIHTGAAGKKLIAWALRVDSGWAQIAYDDEKACCGTIDGLPSEVLSPGVLRATEGLLHSTGRSNPGPLASSQEKPTRDQVRVEVWEERDRLHIGIQNKETGEYYASWWDDEARQMFEDGFFKSSPGLEKSVLDYAEDVGILTK